MAESNLKHILTATVSLSAIHCILKSDKYSQMCVHRRMSNGGGKLHGHATVDRPQKGQPADADTLTAICRWHVGLPWTMLLICTVSSSKKYYYRCA